MLIYGAPRETRTLTHKALASKTSVSTIPPSGHYFLKNVTNRLVCNYYIVYLLACQHILANKIKNISGTTGGTRTHISRLSVVTRYKLAALPIELQWYLVLPRGIEPRSSDLQTGAMTTSAKAALLGTPAPIRTENNFSF